MTTIALPDLHAISVTFTGSAYVDHKSRAEAAELSYLNDATKSNSVAIAAALILAPLAQFAGSAGTLHRDVAAGTNTNTITDDKHVEKQVLALAGRLVNELSPQCSVASTVYGATA